MTLIWSPHIYKHALNYHTVLYKYVQLLSVKEERITAVAWTILETCRPWISQWLLCASASPCGCHRDADEPWALGSLAESSSFPERGTPIHFPTHLLPVVFALFCFAALGMEHRALCTLKHVLYHWATLLPLPFLWDRASFCCSGWSWTCTL